MGQGTRIGWAKAAVLHGAGSDIFGLTFHGLLRLVVACQPLACTKLFQQCVVMDLVLRGVV